MEHYTITLDEEGYEYKYEAIDHAHAAEQAVEHRWHDSACEWDPTTEETVVTVTGPDGASVTMEVTGEAEMVFSAYLQKT